MNADQRQELYRELTACLSGRMLAIGRDTTLGVGSIEIRKQNEWTRGPICILVTIASHPDLHVIVEAWNASDDGTLRRKDRRVSFSRSMWNASDGTLRRNFLSSLAKRVAEAVAKTAMGD